MSLPIDPVEKILLIPKLIELVCFSYVGFRFMKKEKTILNNLFILALLSWIGNIISDIITYIFLAVSPEAYIIANVSYIFNHLFFVFTAFFVYLIAKVIINSGVYIQEHKKHIIIQVIIYLIVTFCLTIGSRMYVLDELGIIIDPNTLPPVGNFTSWEFISTLVYPIMAVPLVLYILSLINLVKVAKRISEKNAKRKIQSLLIGFALLPVGMLYYITISAVFADKDPIIFMIGHVIWTISAFFILFSQSAHKKRALQSST